MQFIAAYFQDFTPNCDYVPEYCGAGVAYPVIEVYKNGKRVDGMIMVRTQDQILNLIVKYGGYKYVFLFIVYYY